MSVCIQPSQVKMMKVEYRLDDGVIYYSPIRKFVPSTVPCTVFITLLLYDNRVFKCITNTDIVKMLSHAIFFKRKAVKA